MKSQQRLVFLLTLSLLGSASTASAGILEDFSEAFNSGSHSLSFRMRHETVEQENILEDAKATTLQTRLTLTSGEVNGVTALIEFDNTSQILADEYDSFVLDEYRGTHSVIADPVYTEVNRAQLSFKPDDVNTLVLGRQVINHAAHRFVGCVCWRQNAQTFDAASYRLNSGSLTLDYSYIWNVNRIFGSSKPSAQMGNLNSDSHILLGTYNAGPGTLGAYLYALEFEDAAALSSMTWGISWSGKLGPVSLNASYATQSDYGNSPLSYDADYYAIDGAIQAGPAKLLLGYEVMGSDNGTASFKTPLATLHKFQGWADLFLNTPANGIEDLYFTVSGNTSGINLAATWHDFSADNSGVDYGTELDLSAGYKFSDTVNTQIKYASYSSDGFGVDTDKLWLSLMVSF